MRDSVKVRVGVRGVGTIRFFSFEGGCWVIETDPRRPSEYGNLCLVSPMVDLDSIRIEMP